MDGLVKQVAISVCRPAAAVVGRRAGVIHAATEESKSLVCRASALCANEEAAPHWRTKRPTEEEHMGAGATRAPDVVRRRAPCAGVCLGGTHGAFTRPHERLSTYAVVADQLAEDGHTAIEAKAVGEHELLVFGVEAQRCFAPSRTHQHVVSDGDHCVVWGGHGPAGCSHFTIINRHQNLVADHLRCINPVSINKAVFKLKLRGAHKAAHPCDTFQCTSAAMQLNHALGRTKVTRHKCAHPNFHTGCASFGQRSNGVLCACNIHWHLSALKNAAAAHRRRHLKANALNHN